MLFNVSAVVVGMYWYLKGACLRLEGAEGLLVEDFEAAEVANVCTMFLAYLGAAELSILPLLLWQRVTTDFCEYVNLDTITVNNMCLSPAFLHGHDLLLLITFFSTCPLVDINHGFIFRLYHSYNEIT